MSLEPPKIFGYGSLMWRPAFAHAWRRPAVVHGWARRFHQGSTDHRGVPGAPGRVVTLERDPSAQVVGFIYALHPSQARDVLARLDVREQGGYARIDLDAELLASEPLERGPARVTALTYVATPDNRNYLGPAPVHEIARQIARCRGPSGPNREYLLRLAAALRELGVEDAHVFDIERTLAHLESDHQRMSPHVRIP